MEPSKYSIFLSINEGKTDSVINCFQNNNIDINLPLNNFNWTSLHIAAYGDNLQLVEFLLKRGANMNIPNASGLTALNLAESKHLWRIVELIKNYEKVT